MATLSSHRSSQAERAATLAAINSGVVSRSRSFSSSPPSPAKSGSSQAPVPQKPEQKKNAPAGLPYNYNPVFVAS